MGVTRFPAAIASSVTTDDAWEDVLATSVRVMPITNPLANAFMTMLHDSMPMPRPVRPFMPRDGVV